MGDALLTNDGPAWRDVVQTAAYGAAVTEARACWGPNEIAFNYRWEHVQAVVRLALRLAELTGADREIVEAAAWLHDIAKLYSRDHGRDGAIAARQVLARTDFAAHKVNAVAEAIEKHVGLFTDEPVEPLEAAVVWDADKLSKLGATSVLHFIGYKVMMGEGTTAEWLDELPNVSWMARTAESFHTPPAQAVGQKRLQTYRTLWQQACEELNGDDLSTGAD